MSHKIAVIEDHAEMADNICSILRLASYEVAHASNGKTGVELVRKFHPDLILCDILMPELDGFGVLHILSKDTETAKIPFIFLTALADKSDFRAGMNLGADDYITKPFDSLDLLKVIETRLKRNELLRSTSSENTEDESAFFSLTHELKDLQKLSENRPIKSYRKKDIVFMEGQVPNDLYFIEKGKVKTYKVNYDGKELITGISQKGEFLGFIPLLEDKPYHESAEVLEDARIIMIPKSDFISLIYSSKDFARKFIRLISNNVDEMEDRLLDLAYQSVRQRVASALLKLSERITDRADEMIVIARKDISGIVGTATESLNRTLADFRDEGLIEITAKGLKILNQAKLEKMLR